MWVFINEQNQLKYKRQTKSTRIIYKMANLDTPMRDSDYHFGKQTNRIYVGKSFSTSSLDKNGNQRKMRIMSKVIDSQELAEFVDIKNELIIRKTEKGRQEIKAYFYEDTREIDRIVIQRFTSGTNKPHAISFAFTPNEIKEFIETFRSIYHLNIDGDEKIRVDKDALQKILLQEDQKIEFLSKHSDLIEEFARKNITKSDIIALAYRKEQLKIFEELLNNPHFFEQYKKDNNKNGSEAVWQHFFEKNQWIFGYGLSYLFTTGLNNKKLEQVTSGHSINQLGKRTDALMKTRGLISSLCFVEIKKHDTELLEKKPYRSGSWNISTELAGSIAQIQKTIQEALKTIGTKLQTTDEYGNPTKEFPYLYQPRSFVVIGNLSEFNSNNGINEDKFSSFELFRRNINNTEIITFDELYERAKFITEQVETDKTLDDSENPF